MRGATPDAGTYQAPRLLGRSRTVASYLKTLGPSQLEKSMQLSAKKASETHGLISSWTDDPGQQRPAIDAFLGDIYSGLQTQSFSVADREYANDHLLILSGLYGGLRALDSVYPYRLEMGYKLPAEQYRNLYTFWGDEIAKLIPKENDIINLSAVEYTKAVLPYLPDAVVITPKFLTVSPKSGEPTFVTVHAKVARGAFARWLIKERVKSLDRLKEFSDLNYRYDAGRSSQTEPVFVCQEFGGIGLSVRLS